MNYSAVDQNAHVIEVDNLKSDRHHRRTLSDAHNWRATRTIVIALLFGLGVALAHHFTYSSLDGKLVAEVSLSQAWISRIGTALAFVAKLAFTISVGASFVQHQWLQFYRRPFRVKDVDVLTGVLGNLLCFLESRVWFHQPLLMLLALVSWLIPFSAVVTPGALSVVPIHVSRLNNARIPSPLYDGSRYAVYSTLGAPSTSLQAHPDIYRLLFQTASSGLPVDLPSRSPNETYSLSFTGPALRCSAVNKTSQNDLNTRLHNATKGLGICTFISWVEGDWDTVNQTLPKAFDTLDQTSQDAARIYVAAVRETNNDLRVTQCLLNNATYDVDFRFEYPRQNQTVSISSWLGPVAVPSVIGATIDTSAPADVLSYAGMMEAFGKLLVGRDMQSYNGYSFTQQTSKMIVKNIDWTQESSVERGLESLFQNLTLSLFSKSELVEESARARPVNVTISSSPNAYSYVPRDLFIAYGASFLAALFCAVIGFRASWINKASYRNVFSTFVRATNDPGFRYLVDMHDNGADPLPRDVSNAKILMPSSYKLRREKPEANVSISTPFRST